LVSADGLALPLAGFSGFSRRWFVARYENVEGRSSEGPLPQSPPAEGGVQNSGV